MATARTVDEGIATTSSDKEHNSDAVIANAAAPTFDGDPVSETVSSLIDAAVVGSPVEREAEATTSASSPSNASKHAEEDDTPPVDVDAPSNDAPGSSSSSVVVIVEEHVEPPPGLEPHPPTARRPRPTSMYGRSLPPSPYLHQQAQQSAAVGGAAATDFERGGARSTAHHPPPPPPPSMPPPPPTPMMTSSSVMVDYLPSSPSMSNDPDRKRWSVAVAGPELSNYKYKLESMEAELSQLQVKNLEITKKYHTVAKTLEDTSESRRRLEATLVDQREENERLRGELTDSDQQRQILQQQMLDMRLKLDDRYEEVNELRHRLRSSSADPSSSANGFHHTPAVRSSPNSSDGHNAQYAQGGIAPGWFENVIKQWEDVRRENEMLRRELTDLREHHQCSEEKSMALEQQLHHERQGHQADSEHHQMEVFGIYQQLHKHVQDRDQTQARFDSLLQKYDDCRRETDRLRSLRQLSEQREEQLSLQYATMEKDYNDTMLERENVLHENNTLYEHKEQLIDRNRKLEQINFTLTEDIMALRQKLERYSKESNSSEQHRMVIEVSSTETALSVSRAPTEEDEVASITRAALEKQLADLHTQTEQLKQTVHALRAEADARESERGRVASELESMRAMCERMRKDRDEANGKLAAALRDTNHLQLQRDKVQLELKMVRDKLELDLSSGGESGRMPRTNASPSHSRDSAIDNDLAEWDIETLEIPIMTASTSGDSAVGTDGGGDEGTAGGEGAAAPGSGGPPLGVQLLGGRDDPVCGQMIPIYVSAVTKGSRFDGLLRAYDTVMQLNEINVANMEHRSVMDMLKNGKNLKMVVKRRRLVGMRHISVQIDKLDKGSDSGLVFDNGVYISKIKTSSAAARAGNLAVGDRIIYVNDVPVEGKTAAEVSALVSCLAETGLVLAVTKSPPVMSPMTPSTSNSVGGGFVTAAAASTMNTMSTMSAQPPPTSVSQQRFFTPLQRKTVCDQQCQTLPAGAPPTLGASVGGGGGASLLPAVNKSKGNILDKVHDKLFGSRESSKKQRVIATASIVPTSNDALTRITLSKGNWMPSSSAELTTGGGGSATSAIRHGSLRSSVRGSLTSASKDKIDHQREEQVLRQFDEMLLGEFDGTNLSNKNILHFHHDSSQSARGGVDAGGANVGGGGSTWPKYNQCNTLPKKTEDGVATTDVTAVRPSAAATVTQRPKKVMQRPSVFPVFQAPPAAVPAADGGEVGGLPPPPLDFAASSTKRKDSRDRDMGASSYSPDHVTSPQSSGVSSGRSAYSTPGGAPSSAHRPISYHQPYPPTDSSRDGGGAARHGYPSASRAGNRSSVSGVPMESSQPPPADHQDYQRLLLLRDRSNYATTARVRSGGVQPNYVDLDAVATTTTPPPVPHHAHVVVSTQKQHPMMIARAHPYRPTTTAPPTYAMPPPYRAPMRLSPEPDYSDRQSLTSQSSSSLPRGGGSYMSGSSNPSLTRPFPRVKPPSQRKDRMSPYQQQHQQWGSSSSAGGGGGGDRRIRISKNSLNENLGISIESHDGSGVFIASVSGLAARNGVQLGDRILDVCGINMRNADLDHARKVLGGLHKAEDIELTVQRTPAVQQHYDAGSTTPRLSSAANYHHHAAAGSAVVKQTYSTTTRDSGSVQSGATYSRERLHSISENELEEPRWVFFQKETGADWGVMITGGNAFGIFVDEVSPDGAAAGVLKPGDRLLELSGINFRPLTLEQAMHELLRKGDDQISALVQYDERKYQKCKRQMAGDSFYVKVNVDREKSNTDELELKQGEVLYVDNTVFNGKMGRWRAWSLDPEGRHRHCGILPAKYKFEEELALARTGSELSSGWTGAAADGGGSEGGGSRRGTIRRSLKFIRRSSRSSTQHLRTPSKESSKDGDATEAGGGPAAAYVEPYQRVERLDYKRKRPVLLVGALTAPLVARLAEDYPQLFARCVPECVAVDATRLEQRVAGGVYVDFRRRERLVEVTTVAAVKDIMEKGFHCLLDVGPDGLERLQRLQIYPVVIQLRFSKGAKQIKELAETFGVTPKVNMKTAKELLDNADKIEKYLATINCQKAIVNITHANAEQTMRVVCQQITASVEHEQKKTIWIISSENL